MHKVIYKLIRNYVLYGSTSVISVLLSLFAWSCLLVQYRLRRSSKDKVATDR